MYDPIFTNKKRNASGIIRIHKSKIDKYQNFLKESCTNTYIWNQR